MLSKYDKVFSLSRIDDYVWDRKANILLGWVRQNFHFMDHSLDIALSLYNTVKLGAMLPCRAYQHGRVTVKSSDKMRSTGGGNGKLL